MSTAAADRSPADEALGVLRELTGRPEAEFREGQDAAVAALVERQQRALVVQRTGWGKSAVYFVSTALLRRRGKGPTLLVSPLLALMRDQVAAAARAGIKAVEISSSNVTEWDDIAARLAADDVDVLLVSPERLTNPRFRDEQLPGLVSRCGLLVVDEAHCVSDWGHDFRPDYRRIRDLLGTLPAGTPVLATTATANERVVADVAEQLGAGGVEVDHRPRPAGPRLAAARRAAAGHRPRPARLAGRAPRRPAGQRHRLHAHRRRGRGDGGPAPRRRSTRCAPTPAGSTTPTARTPRRRCGRTG